MLFQKTNEARSLRILNELCNYLCLFFFPVIDHNFLEVIEKNQTGYNVRKGRLSLRRVLVLFGTYDRNVSAGKKKQICAMTTQQQNYFDQCHTIQFSNLACDRHGILYQRTRLKGGCNRLDTDHR